MHLTNIIAIQEQHKSLGYLGISSNDNYESSFKCNACHVTLKHQQSFQAVWFLKHHAVKNAHQVRAGWILDEQNNMKRSKLQGKVFFITWSFAMSIELVRRSTMLGDGKPLEALDTTSRLASSAFSKTFLFFAETHCWPVLASTP